MPTTSRQTSWAPAETEPGSLVIPAWSFARGNGRIYADPDKYSDAGPVVGGGERQPWGWSLEYDVDLPVTGIYSLHIQYALVEARPIEVYYDARNVSKGCTGVSLSSGSSGKPSSPTWKSSGARWEMLRNRFGGPAAQTPDSACPTRRVGYNHCESPAMVVGLSPSGKSRLKENRHE